MALQIPARDASKYAGHYARVFDPQRIFEIFTDSYQIALSSKNPGTAGDRFHLAVETYHQLMSMGLSANDSNAVQEQMENLVSLFPVKVVMNEALGLKEKARKLKTPKKQLEYLHKAQEIINRGLASNPSSSELQIAASELKSEILKSESLIK